MPKPCSHWCNCLGMGGCEQRRWLQVTSRGGLVRWTWAGSSPLLLFQPSEPRVELRCRSWAGIIHPAKVMDKSHLCFIMWKSLEIPSWKEWVEILLQKWICHWEVGSPVALLSEFIAGMGAFLLRQNFPQFISILYLFISLLAFFLYSKGPFMVKKIYIWFPINNQSYHVLEGKKLLEGNVCRKVQLRASAVFFFS